MKTANRIAAVLIILICLFLIGEASKIESLAYELISNRMFPYMTFGLVLALAAGLLATTFIPSLESPFPSGYWARVVGKRRLITLGLFCVYLLLLPVLGFLPASFGFIVVTTLVLSPQRRKDLPVALALGGGVVGVCYLVFVYWLQFYMP
ncbi:tripartite tricarboxylate transporter TctB family protein [Oleispirillum naphthae]|uniref:tripartite tricarboxylate transporter TctB family protein n=1 Tax=Oleispirillum naphthae TaxID=2838853 RepID=UPI0030824080